MGGQRSIEDEIADEEILAMVAQADAVGAVLSVRANTHGDYCTHAGVAQTLKRVMEQAPNWPDLKNHEAETLHMIAHKIGRILAGDPHFHDHWLDIAGYASLSAKRNAPDEQRDAA